MTLDPKADRDAARRRALRQERDRLVRELDQAEQLRGDLDLVERLEEALAIVDRELFR